MNERSSLASTFVETEPISHGPMPLVAASRIRSMVSEGRLPAGSRLPNELELAQMMGVSRGTLRAALHLLQQQGLVWRRQGIGTFVTEKPVLENRLDINGGVTELIQSQGLAPGCRDIEVKLIAADDYLAQELDVPVASPLVEIRRTRTAEGKPVVASIDVFPAALLQRTARPLGLQALKAVLEQKSSIYRVFADELHISIDHGIAKLRPIKADARLLRQLHLHLPSESVMLYLEQLDYDRDQRPVLLSYEYYVADFCSFTVFRRS